MNDGAMYAWFLPYRCTADGAALSVASPFFESREAAEAWEGAEAATADCGEVLSNQDVSYDYREGTYLRGFAPQRRP